MEVLVIIAAAVGIVVLALWPLAKVRQRGRSPGDQEQLTDTDVVPLGCRSSPSPGRVGTGGAAANPDALPAWLGQRPRAYCREAVSDGIIDDGPS